MKSLSPLWRWMAWALTEDTVVHHYSQSATQPVKWGREGEMKLAKWGSVKQTEAQSKQTCLSSDIFYRLITSASLADLRMGQEHHSATRREVTVIAHSRQFKCLKVRCVIWTPQGAQTTCGWLSGHCCAFVKVFWELFSTLLCSR